MASLYPANPTDVAPSYAQPNASYRWRVLLVLASLGLFLLFYAALLAGAAWLFYKSLTYPFYSTFWQILAIATTGMLCLFTLKFVVKRHRTDDPSHIEISEAQHPTLFAFVRQLCRDTGAPFPHKIFISHEINAAVFYNTSILSLILPTKKNLLIGVGLVNALNLSEFKAVLAHEFGHFSQKSMKLGTYTYTANRIIYDMVADRDKWDDMLRGWASLDFRVAFPAWFLMVFVWGVRQTMTGMFKLINIGHASLSRQMEFNADLMAVSMTGSDALLHGLHKLDRASEALGETLVHLNHAAEEGLYTDDVFYHVQKEVEHLGGYPDNPLGPDVRLFKPADATHSMYASHPSNYDRETNAKRTYVSSEINDRSCWLLFDQQVVRRQLTELFYRLRHDKSSYDATPSREVEKFLTAERATTRFDPSYGKIYDGRMLFELTPDDVESYVADHTTADLQVDIDQLYGDNFQQQCEQLHATEEQIARMSNFLSAGPSRARFRDGDKELSYSEAVKRFEERDTDIKKWQSWLEALDQRVFAVHYKIAKRLDRQEVLLTHYRYLEGTRQVIATLGENMNKLAGLLGTLEQSGEFSQEDLQVIASEFDNIHQGFGEAIGQAELVESPSGDSLASLITKDESFPRPATWLDGDAIGRFYNYASTICARNSRWYRKGLAELLCLQEQLRDDWAKASPHNQAETRNIHLPAELSRQPQQLE